MRSEIVYVRTSTTAIHTRAAASNPSSARVNPPFIMTAPLDGAPFQTVTSLRDEKGGCTDRRWRDRRGQPRRKACRRNARCHHRGRGIVWPARDRAVSGILAGEPGWRYARAAPQPRLQAYV